jgi:hypothetical protein
LFLQPHPFAGLRQPTHSQVRFKHPESDSHGGETFPKALDYTAISRGGKLPR